MHLLTTDCRVLRGADALGVLFRGVWWLWPLGVLLLVPGIRELGRLAYDSFARNRYRAGGTCLAEPNTQSKVRSLDWVVAILFPALAGIDCWNQSPWLLMWVLAFGLGFALKWLAWRDALSQITCPSAKRAFAWFVLWPGLDGRSFLNDTSPVKPPARNEWLRTVAVIALGAVLIRVAVPLLLVSHTVMAAWVGMLGIVLVMHFGVIRLLSILFRRFGVNAKPIMNAPFRATSLVEFWGARWNTAFSIPARRLLLLPLARRIGLPAAGFAVFLISGLLHEVVISLPARAGFGWPILYFILQGAGVATERGRIGRSLGLGKGTKGRLFVILFTTGPLYWLFHPTFANRVIIPFLNVLNNS